MKIGILTYHSAHNYGALLQCFALKRYLKNNGYDVEVIDYKPKYLNYSMYKLDRWVSKSLNKTFKKLLFQMATYGKQVSRSRKFNNFIKRQIVPVSFDLNNVNHNFDCFIFGSDQIWRKNFGEFDPIFFGQFPAAIDTKLISYAASMSLSSLNTEEKKQIHTYLNNFSTINVRESSLQKLLNEITDSEVNLTVDPTLLLDKEEWSTITARRIVQEKYILIYEVIENSATNAIAKRYSDEHGWKIIRIASKINRGSSDNIFETAGVEEFLSLIKNAEMVLTTSYHGTIFSLIFEKAFICIRQNTNADLRVDSILSRIGLSDHFVDSSKFVYDSKFVNSITFDSKQLVNSSKHIIRTSLL